MLLHVHRAETLAMNPDEKLLAALHASGDLREVRSEAGCNMLFVYLLKRWGSIFESGMTAKIEASEDFQNRIVDAYVAASCSVDEEVKSNRKLYIHTTASFRHQEDRLFRKKVSPLSFVNLLLRELHPNMFPGPYKQLQRLASRLASHANGTFVAPVTLAPEEAIAYLVFGTHTTMSGAELQDTRERTAPLGLSVVVAGDPPEPEGLEVVVGLEVAVVSADDGGPLSLGEVMRPNFTEAQARAVEQLGEAKLYLVASGPLASGILVRGHLGGAADGGEGRYVAGSDMDQTPHATGVWGEVVLTADSTPITYDGPLEGLFLIPRYD